MLDTTKGVWEWILNIFPAYWKKMLTFLPQDIDLYGKTKVIKAIYQEYPEIIGKDYKKYIMICEDKEQRAIIT